MRQWLHVNGEKAAVSSIPGELGIPSVVEFGGWNKGVFLLDGKLDEIRIYDRVLVQNEIRQLAGVVE